MLGLEHGGGFLFHYFSVKWWAGASLRRGVRQAGWDVKIQGTRTTPGPEGPRIVGALQRAPHYIPQHPRAPQQTSRLSSVAGPQEGTV